MAATRATTAAPGRGGSLLAATTLAALWLGCAARSTIVPVAAPAPSAADEAEQDRFAQRFARALDEPAPPPPAPASAAAPAPRVRWRPPGDLVPALDALLEQAHRADPAPSLAAGVVHGEELVWARALGLADRAAGRPATLDTIYNAGSVTKVVTATLLGILRDEGRVQLDDPVARYLPPEVRLPSDPRGARTITLRHLATHTSGLPDDPTNAVGPPGQPYYAYTVELLYEELGRTTLVAPVGAEVHGSNLGFALLGQALSRAGGDTYTELVRDRILRPLGMEHTDFRIRPDWEELAATGYDAEAPDVPVGRWLLGCLVPAGALATTVPDLCRFVSLQLRAGEPEATPVAGGTLAELHRPQRLVDERWQLALGVGWWVTRDELLGEIVYQGGSLSGQRAYVAFVPRHDVGVVVLSNLGIRAGEQPAHALGGELLREAVLRLAAPSPEVVAMAEELAARLRHDPSALEELVHASLPARVPLERLAAHLQKLVEEGGRCTAIDALIPGGPPFSAWAQFRMERGPALPVYFELDERPPHRLRELRLP